MARRGYTAILRQLKLLTINAFRVKMENSLENILFLHFLLVLVQFDTDIFMIAVVHTGGYAVIQVKHQRDINLKLSVYL